jgi:arsenite/tail-anchored protein-transporting ATPase
MKELFERRILFIGGKGGVGKTSTAAALALMAAEHGRRCLAVSTDPAHSLGDIFERKVGDREIALAPNLWGLEIDPEAQADRHIAGVKESMRSLVRPAMYGEIERQMDLARLAPGAVEAAMMERVADLMVEGRDRYDLLIFDTAPTGHTLRLLSLPDVMAAWADGLLRHHDRSQALGRVLQRLGGRSAKGDELSYIDQAEEPEAGDDRVSRIRAILLERRRKFHRARRLLLDPGTTAFILVLTPEKLPILESKKALAALRQFDVPVATLVINRVLPDDVDGEFLHTRRRQEAEYLREIDREFADLPRRHLPLLPRDVRGMVTLKDLGWLLIG